MHKLAGRACMNMLGSHAGTKWVLMHELIGCSCVKELVWEAIWACCAHVGHAGSCGSFPWQLEQRCPGVDGAGGGCLGSPYRCPSLGSPPWVPTSSARQGRAHGMQESSAPKAAAGQASSNNSQVGLEPCSGLPFSMAHS